MTDGGDCLESCGIIKYARVCGYVVFLVARYTLSCLAICSFRSFLIILNVQRLQNPLCEIQIENQSTRRVYRQATDN